MAHEMAAPGWPAVQPSCSVGGAAQWDSDQWQLRRLRDSLTSSLTLMETQKTQLMANINHFFIKVHLREKSNRQIVKLLY